MYLLSSVVTDGEGGNGFLKNMNKISQMFFVLFFFVFSRCALKKQSQKKYGFALLAKFQLISSL